MYNIIVKVKMFVFIIVPLLLLILFLLYALKKNNCKLNRNLVIVFIVLISMDFLILCYYAWNGYDLCQMERSLFCKNTRKIKRI